MDRKVAIITGARRGIGEAIAYKLAENNYDIVVNDKEGLEEVKKVVEKISTTYNVKSIGLMADVSDEQEVLNIKEETIKEFGRIDLLVNNAAIVEDIELNERPTETFIKIVNNNINSTYLMSKHIGKYMYENKTGKIINISSTNGINAFFPNSIDYDASKAAVISMTHNFAIEYAPYVLVNSIAPGWVNTEMNKDLPADVLKEEAEKIYLKRFAEPKEIASLVNYLASEENTYINGEIIKIDGGY